MLSLKITFLAFLSLFYRVMTVCDSGICECVNSVCESCLSPYFTYNPAFSHRCTPCVSNCQKCSSSQECSLCSSGYHLNTFTGSCEECEVNFCQNCPQKNLCQKCITGYTLSSTSDSMNTFQCVPCAVSNAQTCDSQTTVLTCKSEYWKNGDSCSPCRQFCLQCTSSTNCLQCADGYRPVLSAGTYCSPCPTGCKQCTDISCRSCLSNYRLVSGSCLSISNECSLIQNCKQCEFSSGNVFCKLCKYPFYLKNNQCIPGSSLLCTEGSSGPFSYSCSVSCPFNAYKLQAIEGDRMLCKPNLWIKNTDNIQYYFSGTSLTLASVNSPFAPSSTFLSPSFSACPQLVQPFFYSTCVTSASPKSILTIQKTFRPYYKLYFKIKMIPLYKSVSPTLEIILTAKMSDNATNQYSQVLTQFTEAQHQPCRNSYFSFQSKRVKDQVLTIQLISQIVAASNTNSFNQASFPYGLIGYTEILIHLYQCSMQCRICSNSKYCLECYGELFLYENQCVDQCYGFFQFYAPNGNPLSYKYKQCLKQCPSGFYSKLSPYKEAVYICSPCQNNCKTCKSSTECLSCSAPYLYYDLGFSCTLSCPSTHYSHNNTCTPCNSPCKTCESQTNCLSCSIGYFLPASKQCVPQCPMGTYANFTSKNCQNCSIKCSQCKFSQDYCTKCVNPYYLLQKQCVDDCPLKTHYKSDGKCQTCKLPCFQCLSINVCLSCSTGYLLGNTCYSVCPTGYYRDVASNTCNQCQPECQECSSQNTCQSCTAGFYLFGSQCLVECPQKTYSSNNTNICLPCVQPCLNCQDSDFCLSCQIGYLSEITPGSCQFTCEPGFYQSIVTTSSYNQRKCLPCFDQCNTCSSFDACLSCVNNSKVLSNNQCLDSCLQGYYQFQGRCQLCAYPCLTCNNSPENCQSCVSPYLLSVNRCVSQCSSIQFKENGKCLACIYPCKTCLSLTQCNSCSEQNQLNNQTYLINKSCLEVCPQGTYADKFTFKCRTCNYPCQTCLNSKACLTCASGYLTEQNRCQVCPPNYYANQTSKKCELCSTSIANCEVCYSQNICRYCQPSYYLLVSQMSETSCISDAQCELIPKYYKNEQQMTCSKCILPCGECISQSKCLTCQSGYLLSNKCLLECPKQYYQEYLSHTCEECNTQICLTCQENPITCLTCNSTGQFPVLMVRERQCIRQNQCPETYYVDEAFGYLRCLKCQPPCLACSGARICESCISGILHNSQCRTSCPINYFESIIPLSNTSVCLQCSYPCLNCRKLAQYCISCQQSFYLQGFQCLSSCSSNYYLQQNILECKPCLQPCLTCSSSSYCTSCISNGQQSLILYYGQCISLCPDGTYLNNLQCKICPQQCQSCFSSNNTVKCQKCSNGYFMNSADFGSCETQCAYGQYSDQYTRQCYDCQSPCLTCLSGIKCSSCVENYLLYKIQCIKGNLCPINTFKDPYNPDCLDICPQPLYYGQSFERTCVQECPYNFIKDSTTRLCVAQCPANYYIGQNKECLSCEDQQDSFCGSLLSMRVNAKSIFNVLYLRLLFSQQLELSMLLPEQVRIEIRPINNQEFSRRLLINETVNEMNFQFNQISSPNTLWIKAFPLSSLPQIQLKISLQSHYIFPKRVLQNINTTTILHSYDLYTPEQIKDGQNLQIYAKAVSIIMCICLVANIIFNTGYLTYSMLDYYQFLFIILYLSVDYTPELNYFLYGFRYAHYLFLPQIFSADNQNLATTVNTPQKFGILVSDASFLNNTGHDFLILFIGLGVLIFCKILELILIQINKTHKSNRIQNSCIQTKNSNASKSSDNKSEKLSFNSSHGSSFAKVEDFQSEPLKILQNIINRFKYNYFNDFLYLVYFYLVMFAFTQTFNLQPSNDNHYISIVFAVIFIILGIAWPIVLAVGIYMKSKNEQLFVKETLQSGNPTEKQEKVENSDDQQIQISKQDIRLQIASKWVPNSQFICYFAQIKPSNNNFGLYLPVLQYVRKLLLAIIFVYCSNHPNFIMGILVASGILILLSKLIYRPYNNRIPFIHSIISQALFVLGCILLTALIVMNTQETLTASVESYIISKKTLGKIIIAIFIILSLYLAVYNIGMIIVFNVLRIWKKKDYYSQFQELENSQKFMAKTSHESESGSSDRNQENQNQAEQSNMRLKIVCADNTINKNIKRDPDEADNQSELSSDLGIYLKKNNSKAPQLLIKCIKGEKQDFEESDWPQQHIETNKQEERSEQSDKKEQIIDNFSNIFNNKRGDNEVLQISDEEVNDIN